MLVNILALVWGGLMIINIALWADRIAVRRFGGDLARRLFWNPFINTFIKPFGNEIAGPAGLADLRDAGRAVLVVGVDLLPDRGPRPAHESRSRPTR